VCAWGDILYYVKKGKEQKGEYIYVCIVYGQQPFTLRRGGEVGIKKVCSEKKTRKGGGYFLYNI